MNRLEKKLLLVDGSYLFYRAYYAFPTMINDIGEPNGAIYGTLNMLFTLLLRYQPSNMIVIFDAKKKHLEIIYLKNIKIIVLLCQKIYNVKLFPCSNV